MTKACYPASMRWPALLIVSTLACGGNVVAHGGGSDAGGDTVAPPVDSGAGGAAESGCPSPPSAPVYDCDAAVADAGSCGPWGSTASSPRYRLGCVVTTTQESTYCGPLTC